MNRAATQMNYVYQAQQKRFYLFTVDLLKGIAIFPMILGHSMGWWNLELSKSYDTSGDLIIIIIWVTGLLVFPCFLYLYGFNQTNSFLIKSGDSTASQKIRSDSIRRSAIFFLFATLSLILMALIQAPEQLLNYLVTWHLFHLFAFSTLFLLILWEITSWFAEKLNSKWNNIQINSILLSLCLGLILLLFMFFHDYTVVRENTRLFPVSLNLVSIIENIFLDVSSCGLIPWLSFPLAGALTGIILKVPTSSKEKILGRSKILFVGNSIFLIFGLWCLRTERFVSAGLGYASTFPHIFISIGLMGYVLIGLLIILDISPKIPQNLSYKLFYPFLIVSKISLTVYFIHPAVGVFSPSLIPSELVLVLLVFMYCLFFVILAHLWQQWDFRYSLEWILRKTSSSRHEGET